jgi:hypothetical protein
LLQQWTVHFLLIPLANTATLMLRCSTCPYTQPFLILLDINWKIYFFSVLGTNICLHDGSVGKN